MIKKQYSQLGQDLWVKEKYPIDNGYFVDVGCSHPINISNTYLLELNGWNGVGIDPLAENYEERKNTKIYKNALFSSSNLELEFIVHNDFSGIKNSINAHKKILTDPKSKSIRIVTKTLEEILIDANSPKFIHYLSIDTEGSEYEILKTFPFSLFTFGCITIEHNYIQPQRQNIKNLLTLNGYILEKSIKWDDWYVLKK